jgi:hypothetical protein
LYRNYHAVLPNYHKKELDSENNIHELEGENNIPELEEDSQNNGFIRREKKMKDVVICSYV